MTRKTHRLTALFVVTTIFLGVVAHSGAATLSPDEQRKARELVRQLGDSDFQAREAASKQLFALGLTVKDLLLEGSRDSNFEIRRRCLDLLPAVLAADRKARLDAFIADKDGKKEHNLPGWKRYQKIAGNDVTARNLFVTIQRSEDALFLAEIERKPKQAAELFTGHCQEIWQRIYGAIPGGIRRPLSLEDVAPLFLAGADARIASSTTSANQMFNFLYQPAPQAALRAGPSPFKKLVLAWMSVQTDANVIQQMMNLINSLNMKEGLGLALQMAKAKRVTGLGLGSVLTTVGKLGTKDHVKELEGFLADKSLVFNFTLNNQTGTTEVRDVALAMVVHLSGQQHKDYGFVFAQTNPWMKFQPHFLGFSNDTNCASALKKWKDWSEAQKKKK